MARVIPAFVHFEDGDAPPKLKVTEGGSDLSKLISERGLEIEEGALEPNPHTHGSDLQLDDSNSVEEPRNGFRGCMSEMLARPEGAERLTRVEAQARFKAAAHECSERKAKEAVEN